MSIAAKVRSSVPGALASACCLLLSGCFIKVSAISDGTVTSNLGADCGVGCPYQVDAGERFARTFTAEAWEGAEFIRWEDDLGELIAGCPSPTSHVCRIEISNLHPALAPLGMQVDARFEIVDGFNVTRFEYLGAEHGRGIFKQVDAQRWVEEHEDGRRQDYRLAGRGPTGVSLTDSRGDGLIVLNIPSKQISTSLLTNAPENALAIEKAIIRPAGELVNRVVYGNAFGFRQGQFLRGETGSWEDRDFGGKREPNKWQTHSVGDEELVLVDASNQRLQINLGDGRIRRQLASGGYSDWGLVHETGIPVDGWNASRVSYGELESGSPLGYFIRESGSRWQQYENGAGIALANLVEQDRSSSQVTLTDEFSGTGFTLNVQRGVIESGDASGPFMKDRWKILEIQ